MAFICSLGKEEGGGWLVHMGDGERIRAQYTDWISLLFSLVILPYPCCHRRLVLQREGGRGDNTELGLGLSDRT